MLGLVTRPMLRWLCAVDSTEAELESEAPEVAESELEAPSVAMPEPGAHYVAMVG